MRHLKSVVASVAAVVLLALVSGPVSAQTPTVLYSFDGIHGADAVCTLTLSGSTLYGMTMDGGSDYDGPGTGNGVIFRLPTSGGTLITGNEYIGTSGGAGTFTQSGGTNMPGQLLLGYADGTAAAGAGAYYLSGNGIVTAGSINLGLSSPGLFVQSSGTCTVTPGGCQRC